ncbi:type IV secretion system protein (plasmid) [Paracoccus pantotrophus]|uniref:Type IV secretion system protein n=1 Tax=Paracoccus pantotrophus TaxID=82367 RepID=A0A7H9C107_PARPN|nr:type IV secretion system protein [Paracoccus pantotrophus]QLH17059.1 type IV secretion system protein [Paracoccus pantotrophus]
MREQWTEGHESYPLTVYGQSGKVSVEVLSINQINPNTATVRFVKTLTHPGEDDRIGNFTATVTYQFVPSQQSALELVWQNPFGFTVTDYRSTPDSLEAQQEGLK